MCSAFFCGHGYSEAFTANMTEMLRLFRQVAGIFQDRQPVTQSGVRFVDSKLRRKLRQKKAALGQKPGGADQQQG